MGKNEWGKDIALILLGIAIGHLLSPNAQVQAILQSVFAIRLWGFPMSTLILIIAMIITSVMLWRLEKTERKNKPIQDRQLLEAIAKKLGITQEDIHKNSEANKTPTRK